MNDKFLELYNQFLTFVEKSDEEGARKFLLDNFKDFPEDVQDKLTLIFFEEALHAEASLIKDRAEVQKEGLEVISQIEKAKKILEDKTKESELRKKLTQ